MRSRYAYVLVMAERSSVEHTVALSTVGGFGRKTLVVREGVVSCGNGISQLRIPWTYTTHDVQLSCDLSWTKT